MAGRHHEVARVLQELTDLTKLDEGSPQAFRVRAYEKAGGVKTECAKLLKIKTSALYYKLEKYGIGTVAGRNLEEDNS